MSLTSSMNTALAGMTAQTTRLSGIADAIAAGDAGTNPPRKDENAGIAETMVELADARTLYNANASVLETGADLWDVLRIIKRD